MIPSSFNPERIVIVNKKIYLPTPQPGSERPMAYVEEEERLYYWDWMSKSWVTESYTPPTPTPTAEMYPVKIVNGTDVGLQIGCMQSTGRFSSTAISAGSNRTVYMSKGSLTNKCSGFIGCIWTTVLSDMSSYTTDNANVMQFLKGDKTMLILYVGSSIDSDSTITISKT